MFEGPDFLEFLKKQKKCLFFLTIFQICGMYPKKYSKNGKYRFPENTKLPMQIRRVSEW